MSAWRHGFCYLILLLAAGGCAASQTANVRELSVHRYVFGIWGGAELDVRNVCPSGRASRIQQVRKFWTYVASAASLGLYLPHQVRITCAEAPVP